MRKYFGKAKGAVAGSMPWVSFGLALLGGCAMALTFLGGLVGGGVKLLGEWTDSIIHAFGWNVSIHLGMVVAVGWAVAAVFDIAADGVPNRMAMWAAALVPSIAATGLSGRLGDWARTHTHSIAAGVNDWASVWLGGPGLFALAVLGIYLATRAQKKARGGSAVSAWR